MTARRHDRTCGFTLVEVLVALVVMAVLAGLAWQGVNGMMVSREVTTQSIERSMRLHTVIAQWERDLESVYTGGRQQMECDGQSLSLTRHVGGGVALVVWSLRGGALLRWASPTLTRRTEVDQQWFNSRSMLGNEPGHVKVLDNVEEFRPIFVDANGSEFNCQSSREATELPRAVDLRLTTDGQALRRLVTVVPLS